MIIAAGLSHRSPSALHFPERTGSPAQLDSCFALRSRAASSASANLA